MRTAVVTQNFLRLIQKSMILFNTIAFMITTGKAPISNIKFPAHFNEDTSERATIVYDNYGAHPERQHDVSHK